MVGNAPAGRALLCVADRDLTGRMPGNDPATIACGEHVYPQQSYVFYGSTDFVPSVAKWRTSVFQKEHGRYEQ
jgi:hypothetical protein